MRSADTKTLAYQNSQKLFTDSGYIHRNDPDDYIMSEDGATTRVMRKNGPPQFKYCKLSKEQMNKMERKRWHRRFEKSAAFYTKVDRDRGRKE